MSVNKNGDMLVTVANCSLDEEYALDISTGSFEAASVNAEILSGDVHSFNSFDEPEKVRPVKFDGCKLDGNKLSFTIPACSVMSVKLKK